MYVNGFALSGALKEEGKSNSQIDHSQDNFSLCCRTRSEPFICDALALI